MTDPRREPDAREVDRVDVLATVDDPARADAFLAFAVVGSTWTVHIRTAEVSARLIARRPLGLFSERDCTCLTFKLALPVPVEPGLRIKLAATDGEGLTASGVVRPWGG